MKRVALILAFSLATALAKDDASKAGYRSEWDKPKTTKERLNDMVLRAAKSDNKDLIKEYIKLGGDLNIQDEKGYTPLIFAAYYGHASMVDILLSAGANPCTEDKRGNTALMGAIFKGNLKIAYRLIRSDCDVDQRNNSNQTALMYASLFDREELVEKLVEHGAEVEAIDNQGNTAIGLATKQGNLKMANLLEENKRVKDR